MISANVDGVHRTSSRSKRTVQDDRDVFTRANGSTWILPPSHTTTNHWPAGGSSSASTTGPGQSFFSRAAWRIGGMHDAHSWFGAGSMSSRYTMVNARSVFGGEPPIAHAHGTHTQLDSGEAARWWSQKVSPHTWFATTPTPTHGSPHQ